MTVREKFYQIDKKCVCVALTLKYYWGQMKGLLSMDFEKWFVDIKKIEDSGRRKIPKK